MYSAEELDYFGVNSSFLTRANFVIMKWYFAVAFFTSSHNNDKVFRKLVLKEPCFADKVVLFFGKEKFFHFLFNCRILLYSELCNFV